MKSRRLVIISLVTTFLTLLAICGLGGLLEIPFLLVYGSFNFIGRVLPQIKPDPGTIATAVVCLLFVTLGSHKLLQWLYSSVNNGAAWPWRWTLKIVALVVILFAAGTAAVGIVHQTGWLVASREPIYNFTSQPSYQAASTNNLKQMGLAAHSVEDNNCILPQSTFTPDGLPLHSWQTSMLPWLEQEPLHRSINHDVPWSHPDNRQAMSTKLKVFLHPAIKVDATSQGYAASHYAANIHTFGGVTPRRIEDYEAGAANTPIIGEVAQHFRAWGDPLNWRDPRLGLNHPHGFSSPMKGRYPLIVFGDGTVRTVNPEMYKELWE